MGWISLFEYLIINRIIIHYYWFPERELFDYNYYTLQYSKFELLDYTWEQ